MSRDIRHGYTMLFLRRGFWLAAMVTALLPGRSALAALRAPYDGICDAMVTEPPTFEALSRHGAEGRYFDQPIPRTLLLVSFCQDADTDPSWAASWQQYAQATGLTLAHATAVPPLSEAAGQQDRAYLDMAHALVAQGDCLTAEKMVRWRLLASVGGAAVDPRMAAPGDLRASKVFQTLFEESGLVVLSSRESRHTRYYLAGVTASDSLVLSSPAHPVITKLRDSLVANVESLQARAPGAGPSYKAGSIALTRTLSGSFVLLPRSITQVLFEEPGDDD